MNECSGFGNWCTGWFDGTWCHCCALHDIAYVMQYDRIPADIALGVCVSKNGPVWMAFIMSAAVLVLGGWAYKKAPHYKLKNDGDT